MTRASDERRQLERGAAREYERLRVTALAAELGEARSGLIFTWGDGSLIRPERFTQWFRDHRAAAGLPRIRLHDLRHTYATVGLARATGWHEVKVISKRLGHTSIGFTLDAYAHVLPAADEDTAHTLARHILGEGTQ